MMAHASEISRLEALGPERLDALVEEVLAEMDPWVRELLSSTDPFKSRLLRAAVLARSRVRHPPTPTETPQLRLALADDESASELG